MGSVSKKPILRIFVIDISFSNYLIEVILILEDEWF